MNPKYPIYVPTKGRFNSRLTIKVLKRINVPFYVVIEPQEYDLYGSILDEEQILVLPWSKPKSSTELVKTRIWIKEHSVANGDKRHWQVDDNIRDFYRLNKNLKVRIASGTIFRAAEDFVDRYENVAIAGFNYELLIMRKRGDIPPFYLNTRIYSMSLILNSIPHKWRDIYNDDTDISLRVLKDGWCTILFNAFLADKMATMTVKGGNTPIYKKGEKFDGRLEMAKSLQQQHPDIVKIVWKWGRWQHSVNYKIFFKKNKLIKKPNITIPQGIDNYGMKLEMLKEGKWTRMNS